MSAPPAGSAGGSPEPNWYPDPSIPGYIRYWSGTSWMPGTSRPEPRAGEPVPGPPEMPPGLSAPAATASSAPPASPAPSPGTAAPAAAPEPAPQPDETGPLYFDEDPPDARGTDQVQKSGEQETPRRPRSAPGALPELRSRSGDDAPAWSPDEDVSTSPVAAVRRSKAPNGGAADPRMPFSRGPEPAGSAESPQEQTIGIRRVDLEADLRRRGEDAGERPAGATAEAGHSAGAERETEEAPQSSWTKQVRELANRETEDTVPPAPVQGKPIPPQQSSSQQPAHASPAHPLPGTTVPSQPGVPQEAAPPGLPQPAHASPAHPLPGAQQPGFGVPPQPAHASPAQPFTGQPGPQQAHPTMSGVLGAPQMTPLTEAGLVVPTQTPWGDTAAQSYPAGLGRRLLARLIDTLVPLGAAAAVALPLVDRAREHIDDKITAAEHAGVNTTVWLVDSTTGVYLALVLGVFLLAGLLLEALPTALWGKSAGKAALRLRVLDMSSQERPGVGAALSRWLLYSVLGLLLIGVVNVLWCLWDRPWRQCLHDKAAGTFVAAPPRS